MGFRPNIKCPESLVLVPVHLLVALEVMQSLWCFACFCGFATTQLNGMSLALTRRPLLTRRCHQGLLHKHWELCFPVPACVYVCFKEDPPLAAMVSPEGRSTSGASSKLGFRLQVRSRACRSCHMHQLWWWCCVRVHQQP